MAVGVKSESSQLNAYETSGSSPGPNPSFVKRSKPLQEGTLQQHFKIAKAAKLAGVSVDTLRRWLEESGFTFNRGAQGRGHAALIPESVLRKIISERSVRLVNVSVEIAGEVI